MTIIDEILDRTDPFSLPPDPPEPLAFRGGLVLNPSYLPSPIGWPQDLNYLRSMFVREVVTDEGTDAPFQVLMRALKERIGADALMKAQEATAEYWGERRQALKEELKNQFQSRVAQADSPFPEDILRRAVESVSSMYVETMVAELVQRGPSEKDMRDATGQAAAALATDSMWLESQADAVATRLKVDSYPHGWLTDCIVWEARRFLAEVRVQAGDFSSPLHFQDMVGPPWRTETLARPRRQVRLVLYADEPDEEHRRRFEAARADIKKLQTRRRGRKPWDGMPPRDQELVHLLYLNLRGESYQRLANNQRALVVVHTKTLQQHLVQLRRDIFSDRSEIPLP